MPVRSLAPKKASLQTNSLVKVHSIHRHNPKRSHAFRVSKALRPSVQMPILEDLRTTSLKRMSTVIMVIWKEQQEILLGNLA